MSTLPARIYLALAGITAVGLGGMILLAPVAFYAGYGIDPTGQVNLLNELRAHGLSILGAGLFIGSGVFFTRLAPVGLLVSAMLYLGYGLSRLVGMGLDGPPGQPLIAAMAVELAIGAIGLLIYLPRRPLTSLKA